MVNSNDHDISQIESKEKSPILWQRILFYIKKDNLLFYVERSWLQLIVIINLTRNHYRKERPQDCQNRDSSK